MEVILVNARHIKNVPGRKTDISDSKWLAGLLRHGLLRGSFIPPKEIRQWRELTRLRRTYTESLADYKRRVHKLFVTANIKIDSVVSDLFGVTGRNLIFLLCDDSELSLANIRENAKGGLKAKSEELYRSIGILHLNKKVVNTFFSNTDFWQSSSIKTFCSCSFISI